MKLTPIEPWTASRIGRSSQAITQADIEGYQLDRLRSVLRLVNEKSRFYRRHLSGASLDPSSLADLACVPFTTPDDIRENPLDFLCVSQDDIQRVVTLDTSGTSGNPKRMYFTRADQERIIDFFHVGMTTFTTPGDTVLILLPGETPGSVGDLLAMAIERLGATAIKHGPPSNPVAALDIIRQTNVNVIVGLPTHVLSLVRQPDQLEVRMKSALLVSDHVPHAIKQVVERAWGCTVYNHYGMTEMGLVGGVECEARHGYHLCEVDLLVEIIDPATGQQLPDGEYGEVVFTTLNREGMPLIRYRTGDMSRFLPDKCPCGTHLKSLERITHRLKGTIDVGGASLTMADLDEALFSIDGVLDFSASLAREDALHVLRIVVHITAPDEGDVPTAARAALNAIPACQSNSMRVDLRVETGWRTGLLSPGKRAIRDERP